MSEPFFLFTSLFDLREAFLLTLLLIGGRFLPFAIYSQTDSPQECQSILFCHEDGKSNDHPASEVVIKWNFRAAMPL